MRAPARRFRRASWLLKPGLRRDFTERHVRPRTAARRKVRLSVSIVGYGLVQRVLQLQPDAVAELRIPLSEGAAAYSESVTVTADRFHRPDPVPAQQILEVLSQNLRGVLTDDALRAVQVLPGVATGDDFRSEFSVRGSDFSHLNFTVDGFATPSSCTWCAPSRSGRTPARCR